MEPNKCKIYSIKVKTCRSFHTSTGLLIDGGPPTMQRLRVLRTFNYAQCRNHKAHHSTRNTCINQTSKHLNFWPFTVRLCRSQLKTDCHHQSEMAMGTDTETHPASVGHASKHSSPWSRPSISVKQTMTISSHPACKPVLHLTHNNSHQNEQKNVLLLNCAIKLCTSFTTMRLKVQSHSYNTCRHTTALLTALQLVTNALDLTSSLATWKKQMLHVIFFRMNVEVTGRGGGHILYKYSATPHPLPGLYIGPLTTPRLIHAEDGNCNTF